MRSTREEREAFGRHLEQALEACDMTQAELRKQLGQAGIAKSSQAVSNWVNGKFAPDRKTTTAIEAIVGTDVYP